jgi:BioD-like phosphotransacetylase family protein
VASILISSSEKYSGKSAVCIGLGTILKRKGYTVGYMKPIGNLLVIKDITPILLTENLTHDALVGVEKELDKTLNDAYSNVSKGKDVVLIEGAGGIGGGACIIYPTRRLLQN